jgi:hypothetical protein
LGNAIRRCAPDLRCRLLDEHPRESAAAQGKTYRSKASWGGKLLPILGGAIQEKAMEPWKNTPKPAMTGNKPAMTGNKPSTPSAKPAQPSCCHPSSSAKKPTTKK